MSERAKTAQSLVGLVLEEPPDLTFFIGLDNSDLEAVIAWAGAIHMRASDNPQVTVPAAPTSLQAWAARKGIQLPMRNGSLGRMESEDLPHEKKAPTREELNEEELAHLLEVQRRVEDWYLEHVRKVGSPEDGGPEAEINITLYHAGWDDRTDEALLGSIVKTSMEDTF